jgi:hypothetical protein
MKHLITILAVMAVVAMFAAPASAGLLYLAAPAGGPDAVVAADAVSGSSGGSLGGSLVTTLGSVIADPEPVTGGAAGPYVGTVVQPQCIPSVPEPGTLSLLGTSLLGLFGFMRRRRG